MKDSNPKKLEKEIASIVEMIHIFVDFILGSSAT